MSKKPLVSPPEKPIQTKLAPDDKWEPIKISNIVLAIAAILSLFFGWYSSHVTIKMNTKAFETSYRPYIGMESMNAKADNDKLVIRLNYKNFGNVPAKSVVVKREVLEPKDVDQRSLIPQLEPYLIFPNVGKTIMFVIPNDFFIDNKTRLIVAITFIYQGMDGISHYTKEIQEYDHTTNLFHTVSGDAN